MEKGTRTCIACKEKFNKFAEKYIKISQQNGEIVLNMQNAEGKSCYVHARNECINKLIKNKILNKKFRKNISEEIYNNLFKN